MYFREIWIKIDVFSFKKMHLNMSSAKYRPFCLGPNVVIAIKISLKFVPKGASDNIPALVQIMACHLFGLKPLSESMMPQIADAYMCQLISMS